MWVLGAKGRRLWVYFADMVNEIVILFRLAIVTRQPGKHADRMKTLLGEDFICYSLAISSVSLARNLPTNRV
jgi:hypothetical protein